ncbi:MAG: imidazoleglycerol-phosphate dehydratase HisB [Dehalococcoidia bacterium]|jgi:imidazoleglycerol-phosphate dehydratase|nr:imidazoleglycerol-phosphate dehydratase HisB [Dehalococcoidia bacterium]
MSDRKATLKRDTKETQVEVTLDLDGTGKASVDTPNGMLNHLVEQLARHSLMDITVSARGDTSPGWHHLVEDVGIVLGQTLHQAVGEGRGILRMGDVTVPLDETLAMVALDLGGRPYAVVKVAFDDPLIGDLPSDLVRHFLEVLSLEGRINLHAQILAGGNDHHKAEALFKALARALRKALAVDPSVANDVPSTKGTISD